MRKTTLSQLDSRFLERWSPRAFESMELSDEQIDTLFEASRWAPSCFNEQPWRFVFARSQKDKDAFVSCLTEKNQTWAKNASLIVAVFAKLKFTANSKPNRWAEFDSGSAWMSLNLQALKMGLHCHGMGGYDAAQMSKLCGADGDEYRSVCVIAIGKKGSPDLLSEDLKAKEVPSDRKNLNEIRFEGKFKS